jgi:hypothetical protein
VTLSNGALQVQLSDEPAQRIDPVEYETFRSPASATARQALALTFVPDGAGNVSAVRLFGVAFARVRSGRR